MNSILVTADALRADHLSQYGYHRDTMPVLDRLCETGTLYEHTFANGTHSGASIPSFLTAQHRGETAIEDGPNIATALSNTNHHTAAFHSNTLIANQFGDFAGFETFEDFDIATDGAEDRTVEKSLRDKAYSGIAMLTEPIAERVTQVRSLRDRMIPPEHRFDFQVYVDAETLTDRVLEWLVHHGDEECFLWVHYMDPHRPYGIDPENPEYVETPPPEDEIRSLMSRAGTDPESLTPDERTLMQDLYDSDLRYTSDHLERLFDGIERHCPPEETLIAFTADHGEEFGEHGYYFHRNYPFDELLHVPLIVQHPDQESGRVEQDRELLDLGRTLCAFHGVTPPEEFEGQLLYEGTRERIIATGTFIADGDVVAVRTPEWKYISVDEGDDHLYHLTEDPDEQHNIATDEPEQVSKLKADIPAHVRNTDATQPPAEPAGDTKRRLEQLGYLE